MATIRLTGAQVTRVRKALARFMEVHPHFELEEDDWVDGGEGHHLPVETLVEDILGIVRPAYSSKQQPPPPPCWVRYFDCSWGSEPGELK